MGFGSFLDLFKSDNWSEELGNKIGEMLDLAAEMFGYAGSVVIYGEEDDDPQMEIYDRDQQINSLEREVRRRVVTRLTIKASKGEVPAALVFMSVVKDCERIGDFIKNLYQIGEMQPVPVDRELYQEYLLGRAKGLEDLLAVTRMAFTDWDAQRAEQIIERARRFSTEAEDTIRQITKSDLGTNDAVCLVLSLRFCKRISLHLSNIVSAVVRPVDKIDFHDEPDL